MADLQNFRYIEVITPVVRTTQKYGWKPPLPDDRYIPRPRFSLRYNTLPVSFINSTSIFNPPIWLQGNEGSCTAHGGTRPFAFERAKRGFSPLWKPAPAFVYWNTRAIEGTTEQDAGASVQDTYKTLVRVGACDDALFPYVAGDFTTRPPDVCYVEAAKHTAAAHPLLQTPDELRGCLASSKLFSFGFTVWSSFESITSNGIMPIPNTDNEHTLGGHCVCALDYDDNMDAGWGSPGAYKCANSWSDWGDKGYFWFPACILHNPNFATDFWAVDSVAS